MDRSAKIKRENVELQRRMDQAIAQAKVCLMSNTKWRKLFVALGQMRLVPSSFRMKLVRSEHQAQDRVPPLEFLLKDKLKDCASGPDTPYREIDWVEISRRSLTEARENDLEQIHRALAEISQFPLELTETTLKVVGYKW
jgi:hypothetical protein